MNNYPVKFALKKHTHRSSLSIAFDKIWEQAGRKEKGFHKKRDSPFSIIPYPFFQLADLVPNLVVKMSANWVRARKKSIRFDF